MKMWLLRVAKPGFQEHSQGVILTVGVLEQGAHRGLEEVAFPEFCSCVVTWKKTTP